MSTIAIIHEMQMEYMRGLKLWNGEDPVARKHFERVIQLGEANEAARPDGFYLAHQKLSELYAFVMEKEKADYYRKKLNELT